MILRFAAARFAEETRALTSTSAQADTNRINGTRTAAARLERMRSPSIPTESRVPAGRLRQQYGLPQTGPLIVATVGSGYDGYPVLEAAQAALERLQTKYPELLAIMGATTSGDVPTSVLPAPSP